MNKYLVTGGCGFIGSNLVKTLVKMKSEVIVVDDLSSGKLINLPNSKRVNLIEKAIQDISILEISHIDGIFHLAAQASVPKSIDRFYESSKNNLLSTIKIFDIAKKKKVPIVYASSSAVYGNLALGDEYQNNFDIISPYALDKLTMENYAKLSFKLFNLSSIGLRFFNVYGPREYYKAHTSSMIIQLGHQILDGKIPRLFTGSDQIFRDFIYIDDVLQAIIKSCDPKKNGTYNVGTGISRSFQDIVDILQKELGTDLGTEYFSNPYVLISACLYFQH